MNRVSLFSVLLLLIASFAEAATPSAVATSAALSVYPSMHKVGIDMGVDSQYDDESLLQNYLPNPGFEQAMESHLILVGSSPTSSTFTDAHDAYDAHSTGFWNGVTAYVRTGTCVGDNIIIGTYTSGGSYTYTGPCTSLAANDLIAIRIRSASVGLTSGSGLPGEWGISGSSVALSTAQHYQGSSSAEVTTSGNLTQGGDTGGQDVGTCANNAGLLCGSPGMVDGTDCGGSNVCVAAPYGVPWHQITGNMTMQVAVKSCATSACLAASSGTPTVTVKAQRLSPASWAATPVSHTFTLPNPGTPTWSVQTYNWTVTPGTSGDESGDEGEWIFTVSATGREGLSR